MFQLNWIGLSNFCHSCYTWESMTLPPICSKEMPAKRWHWTLRKKGGQNRGPGFWRLWQKLCLAPRISPAKAGLGKSGSEKEVFGTLGHLSCRHGEHKPVEQFVRWGSTLKVITVACHPHLDMINTSSQFDLDLCTHLVNVICQTSHRMGNVWVVGGSLFVTEGWVGAKLGLLVARPSRLLGATDDTSVHVVMLHVQVLQQRRLHDVHWSCRAWCFESSTQAAIEVNPE